MNIIKSFATNLCVGEHCTQGFSKVFENGEKRVPKIELKIGSLESEKIIKGNI